MHRRIDDFVDIAERHAGDTGRTESMRTAMFDYLRDRLAEHGYRSDEERCSTSTWL